jgi:circadian clock protein KaiC
MTERLSSGSARLDEVLAGGLLQNAINLLIGAPGTGKTILADQYVFHNATQERPALYYSTMSEPYEKLLRYGQRLTFFDRTAVGTRVFYEPLGPALRAGGLDAVLNAIADGIKQHRPGIIVIDSFRALTPFGDAQTFRSFLADLADLLTAFPVSAFWVGEYNSVDIADAAEFAVADAILSLSREDLGLREVRYLQVLKCRGSHFLSGKHACRISSSGIDVFPRLADATDSSEYAVRERRMSSGIAALDALLHEGFWAGSSTLVAGPAGSGKTMMGLHFAFDGARSGEPTVVATFQENPSQLQSIASRFGWSMTEPGISLLYASSVDLYVDEWMYTLFDRIEQVGATRVLIDSLGDVQAAVPDNLRFREYVYSFIQRCARRGITTMMTLELPELFLVTRLTERGYSHLADNVVLLQYVHDGATIRRAVSVMKSRGTSHDPRTHEFDITSDGIVLGGDIVTAGPAYQRS